MFERLVQASDAMREADVPLIPAMSGCRTCGTVHVIAAPALGTCVDCGAELVVLAAGAVGFSSENQAQDVA